MLASFAPVLRALQLLANNHRIQLPYLRFGLKGRNISGGEVWEIPSTEPDRSTLITQVPLSQPLPDWSLVGDPRILCSTIVWLDLSFESTVKVLEELLTEALGELPIVKVEQIGERFLASFDGGQHPGRNPLMDLGGTPTETRGLLYRRYLIAIADDLPIVGP